MHTLFDCVPLEVIRHNIRPFIVNDYFARIAINSILPPADRQGTPLRVKAIKELELEINWIKLNRLEKNIKHKDKTQETNGICKVYDYLLKNPFILQHHEGRRNMYISKATDYANPDYSHYTKVYNKSKLNLIDKASLLIELINKKPFICHYNEPCELWSPIFDAGHRTIVDNSRILFEKTATAKEMSNVNRKKIKRAIPQLRCFMRPLDKEDDYGELIEYDEYDEDIYEDEGYEMYEEYGYFDINTDKWIKVNP
jgi:hypothetical protein